MKRLVYGIYSAVYRSGHREVLRVVEALMPQEPWLVCWFAVLTFEAVCWPMLLVRRQPAGKQGVAIGRALVRDAPRIPGRAVVSARAMRTVSPRLAPCAHAFPGVAGSRDGPLYHTFIVGRRHAQLSPRRHQRREHSEQLHVFARVFDAAAKHRCILTHRGSNSGSRVAPCRSLMVLPGFAEQVTSCCRGHGGQPPGAFGG